MQSPYRTLLHQSRFPDEPIVWTELVYFRDWQATGLVKIYYYFMLALGILSALGSLILMSIHGGVGGFFLGLLYTVILLFAFFLAARITAELCLSLFAIRDALTQREPQSSNQLSQQPLLQSQQQQPQAYDPRPANTFTGTINLGTGAPLLERGLSVQDPPSI
eukprot:gnl/Hemi2/21165_TR7017_c0_g1_i1.p1 gnl/Hemi2/21165_TR7017_c0_g1~~gnl/Hemi2/21165_TR7017_c0_g1_i1.p1  ORF type:complete len:163 (-),score=50.60 gnl/Hemi2/21165_TR7017_c0_g1_i1:149-637(-)